MKLCRVMSVLFLLFPVLAWAHNFVVGQTVTPVSITDRGEQLLRNGIFSYQPWNSSELAGKVRVVQYIAGRTSAKKENSLLVGAIKNAQFPGDRFQPTTIVNTDDSIPGTGYFVRKKIEKNQRRYPWAQFIIDSNGIGRKAWQLKEESSTILVLDKQGQVQWAKDGALTPQEVRQVMSRVAELLNDQ
ncbi:YtfJ family protein [Erwinia sorbitola]|uniref:YtfJ family protein n=1 Tax=Erwinia sorbitola TaxID=2681984 RepID=A0ABW9R9E4_9GAMM|nr:YtfJ family protein [Erwinia sorbitola]MTD26190.1 YtfJ family protein [Erwinia sorbitola]